MMRIKNNFLHLAVFTLFVNSVNLSAQESPLLILPGQTESVNCIAYSPDGKRLVSGSKDGQIKIWDAEKGYAVIKTITVGDAAITGLSYSHSGKILGVGTFEKFLLYDASTLKKKCTKKKAHVSFVKSLNFSNNDSLIVTSSWKENALMIWNAKNLKKVIQLNESEWTDEADFTPDDKYVLSVNHANIARQWDISTGNVVKTFAGHTDWIYALKISADQRKLITAGLDQTIKIWDLNTGKILNTLEAHSDCITGLSVSADQRYLASCSLDSTVKVWDISAGILIAAFKCQSAVLSVAFSPGLHDIAAAEKDKVISIWDITPFLKKD